MIRRRLMASGDIELVRNSAYHSLSVTLLAGLLFCALAVPCPAAQQDDDRLPAALSNAEFFANLARDHGLNCRGKQTPADLLRIRTLLRAALRFHPNHNQACTWLYELARLEGRADEAADMLERILAAEPDNHSAFANWLSFGPTHLQTLEQRRSWLLSLISKTPQPERQALIYAHLTRIARQQLDPQTAADYLRKALDLWPECIEAADLSLEFEAPDAPLAERLNARLRLLRLRPLELELAWSIGRLLDQHEFAAEALEFYEYALSLHEKFAPGRPLAFELLLDLAQNAAVRGDNDKVIAYAQRAAQVQYNTYEGDFFLYWFLEGRATPDLLASIRSKLARAFADIKEPAQWPVALVAQAAWFYCIIDQQPQRALLLAEDAARRAPANAFVTRVLGWAQALNGRVDDACRTFLPIARQDAFAAYGLASQARENGDEAEAARIVSELIHVPPYGRARALLESLKLPLPTSQPPAQRYPDVPALLAGFDRRVFQLHENPRDFIQAEIRLTERSLLPARPWRAICSITNVGPFPITLGPDAMLNPIFLLSFRLEGDRARELPQLLTVAIDHARVVQPGQTVQCLRSLDVGPLRAAARRAPQHLLNVTLSAILDPQHTPHGWRPSLLGYELRPVSFLRLPANTDPEAWNAWFQQLKTGEPEMHYLILETFGQLLGESQRAAAQQLNYKPQPIPAARVQAVFRTALTGESWELTVHALEALQAAGLDRSLLQESQRALEHPHWAVRFMAVRLLARQGKAFADQARQIASNDPDELVRDLARSYLESTAEE